MSKNRFFILFAAALLFSCCQRPFEEHYSELRLNTDEYQVSSDEGKCVVSVYYSGSWSVALDSPVSWVEIQDASNDGIGDFRLVYTKNEGPSRSCSFTLNCDNGESREMKLVQKGRSGVSLVYGTSSIEIPSDAMTLRIPFTTTLSRNFVETIMSGLIPDEAASWISNAKLVMDENPLMATVAGYISIDLAENSGAEVRETSLNSAIVDATESVYGTAIDICQDYRKAFIDVPSNKKMRKSAAGGSIAINTNLGSLADSIKVAVSYPDGTDPFINDLAVSGSTVTFNIDATTADRSATFTFTYDDGNGVTVESVTEFLQTVSIIKGEITVAQAVEAFSTDPSPYTGASDDHDDFITLYVVGGRNPNMEENINTAANEISTEENDRTFYAQDDPVNPKYGFRVQFASSSSNSLAHGDKIELVLSETTLLKETNPDRYSIIGVSGDLVEVVDTDIEIVPVDRTVATLTDSDIYTYVKISDLEFQVKEGCFSNVREYDAITNPYTPDGMAVNMYSSNNRFAKDGAANLLFDSEGHTIYMLVNMACDWRRVTDEKVPQGVGNVAGVLVHKVLPRWGGNVGTYSIRPLNRSDIEFSSTVSNYSTLAAWVLTKGNNREAIVSDYNWLGGYTQGTASMDELPQNKLLATDGPQTESAVLYSENLVKQRSTNATLRDPQYPITAQSGYRGLDVSDPNSAPKYGMSKGSVISISSNPSGWLEWDADGKWTGGFKGIVMEFSTSGISGSLAAIGFNIASGRLNPDNKTNAFWQHQTSYPVTWKVQLAVSDDGANWSEYSDAVNQATGLAEFTMQSNPWAGAGLSHYYNYTSSAKAAISTPADNPFGLPSYRFALPASFFGHSKVKIRIVPTTDVVATYNADWGLFQDAAQMHAVAPGKQKQNVHNNILIEDIYIQYK